ncbi:MAG: T9SS type A sorting domain-containing protein [Candidatus Cloacimonetes bacterium]|nr:T9SS type A sorting domain-containing protein [Candidatus Cloacimonadota bacterium]
MKNMLIILTVIAGSWLILAASPYPDFAGIISRSNQALEEQAALYNQLASVIQEDGREMENYDVTYYGINIDIDFESHYIDGLIILHVLILEDGVTEVQLHLTDDLEVSGINSNGDALDFTHQNGLIFIDPGSILNSGMAIEFEIAYHGYPVNRLNDGMKFLSHGGVPVVFTMVSPRGARKWWPCKDTPLDKPDSLDLWITYPEQYISASNGLQLAQVDNGDGTRTDWWHESYPIATYLTSLAITNYQIYSDVFSYQDQQMNVDNYIYPEQSAVSMALFSETPAMLDFFSAIYGPYPFLSEKYGHAVCTNLGALAMEHQTCTSFDSGYITDEGAAYTVAHELAHQWAGDCVTIGSWAHVWLKEGFARYSEALWAENLYGAEGLHNYMNNLDTGSALDPALYRDPDGQPGDIFNIVIYSKGAWTQHMLRGVLGDTAYFAGVISLMTDPDFRYGNFLTADLEAVMSAASGMELDWFFDSWFYQEGRPSYKYALYTAAEDQQPLLTLASLPYQIGYFPMFIPYDYNNYSDRLFAEGGFNYFVLPVTGNVQDIQFDPDNWVLDYGFSEQVPVLDDIITREGHIGLTWSGFFDPAIAGFNIYRSENQGEFLLVNEQPVTGTFYFDQDLDPGSSYRYKIAAVREGIFQSKFSNIITAEPITYSFDEGILLVDNTGDFTNPTFPSDEEVDDFYHYLLTGFNYSDWDIATLGEPPLTELALYSTVIWHNDDILFNALTDNFYRIKNYLTAGGRLLLSTCRSLGNIPAEDLETFLGISSYSINNNVDFIGATGLGDYPDVFLDMNKIPMPTWNNAFAYVYGFASEVGAETIYLFDALSDDPLWENQPCALHYSDPFQAIVLGFPLFFMQEASARELMLIALDDLGEFTPAETGIASANSAMIIYPNPFNAIARIDFLLPRTGSLSNSRPELLIYNLRGQLVRNLPLDNNLNPGWHSLTWYGDDKSGRKVSSGIYLCRLSLGNISYTRKMVLLQ